MPIKTFSSRLTAAPVLEDTPQNRQKVVTRFAKLFMPAGALSHPRGSQWLYRSGITGAKILKQCAKSALAVGFVKKSQGSSRTSDGSIIVDETVLQHPVGWVLRTRHVRATNNHGAPLAFRAAYVCELTAPK